jgi:predicted oxidoreductase (fatty acid repression mutant protein)
MASSMDFLAACENRRSIYQLTDKIPISDARVEEIARHNIQHVPHSFNAQSTRLVVLLNDEHKQFWEFVKEVLKPQVPEDQFPKTVEKLDGFKAGHGTVSYYDV